MKSQLKTETKVEVIYKQLRDLAFTQGPSTKLPTIRQLCDQLATTRVTLSEALNKLEAEQILYRRERQGIFVSPTIYHKSIGILFDSSLLAGHAASPFWSMLWISLEQEAQQRSTYRNEICTFHFVKPANDNGSLFPPEISEMVEARKFHGLLTIGANLCENMDNQQPSTPNVSFAAIGHWNVTLDTRELGRLATITLVQQNCKRIGIWTPVLPQPYTADEEPIQAMRQVLNERKIPYFPEFTRQSYFPPSQTSLTLQEQGYLLAKEVFGSFNPVKPDGIFIANDMMTDGALVALDELDIQIGHDVQIVTHANTGSPILFGRTKNMTVYEFDPTHIVQAMFSLLDKLMMDPDLPETMISLRPHLRQLSPFSATKK
ncbi:substrate-binding domain-containing protein [Dictyobacter alpinus]|uniref:substrate-binding domain-containing protein n=1 Tax=Dictyobacter alpinus TaxID=2014873 RepID=UPI0013871E1D|nr:substrate-binding domain-containing protein [Dictyobacter alpinus]